ncbi:DNA (cytosine-5-)-methyltransferase [Saccharopolyspora gloriosae]|uniref:DNA (cytosine-5-)-methyltransferase n=1 Tax=Saccharopolyspora gloriosae TaxID=455344 RepID=A0A840NJT3_9PSEU|nr:DNA (cytosine-5-)-methyltransferase [Saccharopolyspora gloriosae]MBB5072846.1 DNA (cytosine-5)-methyltransferase 1 [Saccharopolyspora gloriosae]
MSAFDVVEICAGAGGQALGLEKAGFEHALAVELDSNACNTLRENRPSWKVAEGDVADIEVWDPAGSKGVSLLAGGVPCPPFTIAGKQLGSTDERDLFAWAVEQMEVVMPRALLLENVRGLSMPRFAGYRQHILDRLTELGYVAEWKLLQASDFGVPQLRPRFVLVALRPDDAAYFAWPEPQGDPGTVGQALEGLMGTHGWEGTAKWVQQANKIAPTIVGGSKKHGGADLGPTRAKRAWAEMGVDALGIANDAPHPGDKFEVGPKITTDMAARLQGWLPSLGFDIDEWKIPARKTSKYRQIANAFPPPVAAAVGAAIIRAFRHEGSPVERTPLEHDPIYKVLKSANDFMTQGQIIQAVGASIDASEIERRISLLSHDFDVEVRNGEAATAYRLGQFRAFTGQDDHARHELFLKHRARIS